MVARQIFTAPNGNKISAPVGYADLDAFANVLRINIKIARKLGRNDIVARDEATLVSIG